MKRFLSFLMSMVLLFMAVPVMADTVYAPTGGEPTALFASSGSDSADSVKISGTEIPAFSGSAYVTLKDNQPAFDDSQKTTEAFETYGDLDSLGRCTYGFANICQEIMPTEERGKIGSIKPSGWHTVKYNGVVDGNYLYNRCHLVGYQLAGENANEKNLITGTRFLNVEGMLPFENMVADYVCEKDAHVLYRVTPVFEGNNLVASGVHMEAWSVEDQGAGICFNIFVYNVQPGVAIDYATGDSHLDESVKVSGALEYSSDRRSSAHASDSSGDTATTPEATSEARTSTMTYVLNTNTKRFHSPDCKSVTQMSEKNKETVESTREELIAEGYTPCGNCNP